MKRVAFALTLVLVGLVAFACQQAGPLSEQDKAAIEKQHEQ